MSLSDNEEQEELTALFSLRVHGSKGNWWCICARFERDGRCRHLVPFLPEETVEVKEEYL